jgi:hypothetical protein
MWHLRSPVGCHLLQIVQRLAYLAKTGMSRLPRLPLLRVTASQIRMNIEERQSFEARAFRIELQVQPGGAR